MAVKFGLRQRAEQMNVYRMMEGSYVDSNDAMEDALSDFGEFNPSYIVVRSPAFYQHRSETLRSYDSLVEDEIERCRCQKVLGVFQDEVADFRALIKKEAVLPTADVAKLGSLIYDKAQTSGFKKEVLMQTTSLMTRKTKNILAEKKKVRFKDEVQVRELETFRHSDLVNELTVNTKKAKKGQVNYCAYLDICSLYIGLLDLFVNSPFLWKLKEVVNISSDLYDFWAIPIWFAFYDSPLLGKFNEFLIFLDIIFSVWMFFDAALRNRVEKKAQEASKKKHTKKRLGSILENDSFVEEEEENESVAQETPALSNVRRKIQAIRKIYPLMVASTVIISSVFSLINPTLMDKKISLVARVLLLGRLIKFINIVKEAELRIFVRIELGQSARWFSVIFTILILAYGTAHWVGCMSYGIQRLVLDFTGEGGLRGDLVDFDEIERGTSSSGFSLIAMIFGDVQKSERGWWQLYFIILFKGLQVGYGNSVPGRPIELACDLINMILQLGVRTYAIGSVLKFILKKAKKIQEYEGLMGTIEGFCEEKQFPPTLRKAIFSHFEYQVKDKESENKLLAEFENLPSGLKTGLLKHDRIPIIHAQKFLFELSSEDFVLSLARESCVEFVVTREVVAVEGDAARAMIFLLKGGLEVMRPNGESMYSINDIDLPLLKDFLRETKRKKAKAGKGTQTGKSGLPVPIKKKRPVVKRFRQDEFDDVSAFSCIGNLFLHIPFLLNIHYLHEIQAHPILDTQIFSFSRSNFLSVLATQPEQEDLIFVSLCDKMRLTKTGQDKPAPKEEVLEDESKSKIRSGASAATLISKADTDPGGPEGERTSAKRREAFSEQWFRDDHFLKLREVVQVWVSAQHAEQIAELVAAAGDGETSVLNSLILKGVDVNEADYDMRAAIHLAAAEGHVRAVEMLVKAKADVNCVDRWGVTPLQEAIQNGHLSVVSTLKLHQATFGPSDQSSVLCTAALEGNLEKIGQIIDGKIDPNIGDYDQRTPLHLAAAAGKVEVVAFLLKKKADVNIKDRWGCTAIEDAVKGKHGITLGFLSAAGSKLRSDFAQSALFEAVSKGDTDICRMLISAKVNFDQRDYDERTPTHLAAADGQIAVLHFLLFQGHANPNALNRWKATPLQEAARNKHLLCCQLLKQAGGSLGPSASPEDSEFVRTLKHQIESRGSSLFGVHNAVRRATMSAHNSQGQREDEINNFWPRVLIKEINYLKSLATSLEKIRCLLHPVSDSARGLVELLAIWRYNVGFQQQKTPPLPIESPPWVHLAAIYKTSGKFLNILFRKILIGLVQQLEAKKKLNPNHILLSALGLSSSCPALEVLDLRSEWISKVLLQKSISTNAFQSRILGIPQLFLPTSSVLDLEKAPVDVWPAASLHPLAIRAFIAVASFVWEGRMIDHILKPTEALGGRGGAVDLWGGGGERRERRKSSILSMFLRERSSLLLVKACQAAVDTSTSISSFLKNANCSCEAEKLEKFNASSYDPFSLNFRGRKSRSESRPMSVIDPSFKHILDDTRQVLVNFPEGLGANGEALFQPGAWREDKLCSLNVEAHIGGEDAKHLRKEGDKAEKNSLTKCRDNSSHLKSEADLIKVESDPTSTDSAPRVSLLGYEPSPLAQFEVAPLLPAMKVLELGRGISLRTLTALLDFDEVDMQILKIKEETSKKTRVKRKLKYEKVSSSAFEHLHIDANFLICKLLYWMCDVDSLLEEVENLPAQRKERREAQKMESNVDFDTVSLEGEEEEEENQAILDEMEQMMKQRKRGSIRMIESEDNIDHIASLRNLRLKRFRAKLGACFAWFSGWLVKAKKKKKMLKRASEGRKRRQSSRRTPKKSDKTQQSSHDVELRKCLSGREIRYLEKKFFLLDENGEGEIDSLGVGEMVRQAVRNKVSTLDSVEVGKFGYAVFEYLQKPETSGVTLEEFFEAFPSVFRMVAREELNRRKKAAAQHMSWTQRMERAIMLFFARHVLMADTPWLLKWDRVVLSVSLFYLISVPFYAAFLPSIRVTLGFWAVIVNASADVFMICNCFLNLFRSHGSHSRFLEIRDYYVTHDFWKDLLGLLPLDLLIRSSSSFSWAARFNKLFFSRFLWNLSEAMFETQSQEAHVSNESLLTKLSQILGQSLVALHWLACMWWVTAMKPWYILDTEWKPSPGPDGEPGTCWAEHDGVCVQLSWIDSFQGLGLEQGELGLPENLWKQYAVSFHWVCGIFSRLGVKGSFAPRTWDELLLYLIFSVLGVLFVAFISANIIAVVYAQGEEAGAKRDWRRLKAYFEERKVESDIVEQVQTFFLGAHGAEGEENINPGGGNESLGEDIFEKVDAPIDRGGPFAFFSFSLKKKITSFLYLKRLSACSIFSGCSFPSLSALCLHIEEVFLQKQNYVFHAGEKGNYLLWLVKGDLEMLGPPGDQGKKLLMEIHASSSELGTIVNTELPFLFSLDYPFSLRASRNGAMLFALSRKRFFHAMELFPEELSLVNMNALSLLETTLNSARIIGGMTWGGGIKSGRSGRSGASSVRGTQQQDPASVASNTYSNQLQAAKSALEGSSNREKQKKVVAFLENAYTGGWKEMKAMLDQKVVNVNDTDYDSRTALHLAVCAGNMEIVSRLVNLYGASVTVKDRMKNTPMDDAVREDKIQIAEFLRSEGGAEYLIPEEEAANFLCSAAAQGDIQRMDLLCRVAALDANTGHLYVFPAVCCIEGCYLRLSPVADYDQRTALHLAASNGQTDVVRYLLGDLKNLQSIRMDRDLAHGNAEFEGLEIDFGTEVNPVDRLGNTPLDDAIRHEHPEIQVILREHGGSLGASNSVNTLCVAAANNDTFKLGLLIDCKMAPDGTDPAGRTPLHIACSLGHMETPAYLLKAADSDINKIDRFGNTPLDEAYREDQEEVVALLLGSGALRAKDPRLDAKRDEVEEKLRRAREEGLMAKVEEVSAGLVTATLEKTMEHLALKLEKTTPRVSHLVKTFRSLILQALEAKHATIEVPDDGKFKKKKIRAGVKSKKSRVMFEEDMMEDLTMHEVDEEEEEGATFSRTQHTAEGIAERLVRRGRDAERGTPDCSLQETAAVHVLVALELSLRPLFLPKGDRAIWEPSVGTEYLVEGKARREGGRLLKLLAPEMPKILSDVLSSLEFLRWAPYESLRYLDGGACTCSLVRGLHMKGEETKGYPPLMSHPVLTALVGSQFAQRAPLSPPSLLRGIGVVQEWRPSLWVAGLKEELSLQEEEGKKYKRTRQIDFPEHRTLRKEVEKLGGGIKALVFAKRMKGLLGRRVLLEDAKKN